MDETESGSRSALFREAAIFQLKLMADGLRDVILLPVSLAAALVGLLRGGGEPDREFRRVMELGRQSEQWINLFGQHHPPPEAGQTGSLDQLLERTEAVVLEQVREGGITESAAKAIERLLRTAQQSGTRSGGGRRE